MRLDLLASLVVVSLPALAPVRTEAAPLGGRSAAEAPRVRYFKDLLPTTVEAGRVAIRLREGASLGPLANAVLHPDPESIGAVGYTQWTFAPRDSARVASLLANDPGVAFVAPILRDGDGYARIPTSELIVAFDQAVAPEAAESLLASWQVGSIRERDAFGLPRVYLLETGLTDGADVVRVADLLTDLPMVRFAESNALLEAWPGEIPNDPIFGSQWGLHNTGQVITYCSGGPTNGPDSDIDGPETWDLASGNPSVLVVVIDNGVQITHPDLQGDTLYGFDPTGQNGGGFPVSSCDNHGTAVAGCVCAKRGNGIGVAGIASGVSFGSARISTVSPGCGTWTVQPSWVASSLTWSQGIGARITNTSWSFAVSSTITTAYDSTANAGLLHFACSHNQSAAAVTYPASLASVVAVGGIAPSGALAWFSNYGADQELVAPAETIVCTDRTGTVGYNNLDYACVDGTSFASPAAAGVAGLMLSIRPSLTGKQVRVLMRTATVDLGASGWDNKFGWGLVNGVKAARAAMHPGDLNFDGAVKASDLAILLGAWNSAGPVGDLDGNGTVGPNDLSILLGDWTG